MSKQRCADAGRKCNPVSRRVTRRRPAANQVLTESPTGAWFITECSECGRFFGYKPANEKVKS